MKAVPLLISLLSLATYASAAGQEAGIVYVDAWGRACAADSATYERHYRRLADSIVSVEDFTRSGRIRSMGTMTDPVSGRRVGRFRSFHSTGGPECLAEYVDGKLQGEVIWLYPTGRVSERGQFQSDSRVGLFSSWYPHGGLKAETSFRGGKRHGRAITWHPNGGVKSVGAYRDDREWGRWLAFYEDGMLEGLTDHDSTGEGRRTWFDRSGLESGWERLRDGRIVEGEYFMHDRADRCYDSTAYQPPLPVGVSQPNGLLAYFQAAADSLHPIDDDSSSGTVGVYVVVEPGGTLALACIQESTNPSLDEAALDVVRRTTWKPGLRHHTPTLTSATVPVRFRARKH